MKPTIESLQNPKIKLAMRLRDSRFRRRSGQIVIDGVREIEAARCAGVAFESIFCSDALTGASEESVAAIEKWPADLVQPVSQRVMEKIAFGQRMSRAVAIASTPALLLDGLQLPSQPLIVVLDRVEKPGNIGAVARTVAAAGGDALVLTNPQCEVFNPNAIRASLGTVFSLPIAAASTEEFQNWLEPRPIRVARACVDGAQSMWQCDLGGALAIVLGSEAFGLGVEWNQTRWPSVVIPMRPGADSLNLSVSAAVLCYEALRQRGAGK